MRKLTSVLLVASAFVFAAGAQAHPKGPGLFTGGHGQAQHGFLVLASFGETALNPSQSVTYLVRAHEGVGYACGGHSLRYNYGTIWWQMTVLADGSGNYSTSLSFGVPSSPALSCPGGRVPSIFKLMVRSIQVQDQTNRHHMEVPGGFISKR